MKSVVCFITGTNAVGKSTLARYLIGCKGGIQQINNSITYCKDGVTCFLGKYNGNKFEGVDTFNTTRDLHKVVETALQDRKIIFGEGFYLHTFGLNLQKAILQGERQMVVFLYAPIKVIDERLKKRSCRGGTIAVYKTQKSTANAAISWKSIGIPVLCFDTSKVPTEQIGKQVLEYIDKLTT